MSLELRVVEGIKIISIYSIYAGITYIPYEKTRNSHRESSGGQIRGNTTRIHSLWKFKYPNVKCSQRNFMFPNIKFGHSLLDIHFKFGPSLLEEGIKNE